jgi:hypothetical protein
MLGNTEEAAKKALETGGLLYHTIAEATKSTVTASGATTRAAAVTTGEGIQAAAVVTGEAVQTTAVIAGTEAQTTAQAAGASEGLLVSAGAAIKQIAISAYTAAAGAYAALESIPYVGPVLAPIAAGAALAAVFALGSSIASSEGGDWDVDRTRLNIVHAKETIMPAAVAGPMRDFFSKGGATGGSAAPTINVSFVHNGQGPLTRADVMNHSRIIADAVAHEWRNGNPVLKGR